MSALLFHLTTGEAESVRTAVARGESNEAHEIQRRTRRRASEEQARSSYPTVGDVDRRRISLNSG